MKKITSLNELKWGQPVTFMAGGGEPEEIGAITEIYLGEGEPRPRVFVTFYEDGRDTGGVYVNQRQLDNNHFELFERTR